MKATCLLLCLALAHNAAGHIFRRQNYPRMDGLIVQPMEYIQQNQLNQQEPQVYKQRKNQKSKDNQQPEAYQQAQVNQLPEAYQQPQAYQLPRANQQPQVNQLPEAYQQPRANQQPIELTQKQLRQQQKQSDQVDTHYPGYQQILDIQHQQSWSNKKQMTRPTQQILERTHDSTSIENSQEIREMINEYAAPVYADVKDLNSRLYNSLMQENVMKPVYSDVIPWSSVQIADGTNYLVNKADIEWIFNEAYKTMNHVSKENKKIFHQNYEAAARIANEDTHLNATELLTKYQYGVETHEVKTDDGYFLTLFRIAPKEPTLKQRPVVFLMHGLLGSADNWLLMGPGKSLAYRLADAGYEVWLGNARGSTYSRRHVSRHYALADFWQFGTDEIALHDLPAMIDYVLKTSNQEKMFYVGYSQGTTAFFALASERPEYNDKIIKMYAMSPMAYMTNVRSPLFRMIAPNSQFNVLLHQQLGHGEFKPTLEFIQTVGGVMCENEIGCRNVCSNVNFVMSGFNVENVDLNLIPVIMGHLPAGASTRQVKQYAQAVASNEFTKYDFGPETNVKVYGQRMPTKYDMRKVQTPVALYYSEEDWLAHPMDVERLMKELPNVTESFKVTEPHFTSMDFQFSRIAPEVVYNRIIESMNQM